MVDGTVFFDANVLIESAILVLDDSNTRIAVFRTEKGFSNVNKWKKRL